jgi:hypothetical protein
MYKGFVMKNIRKILFWILISCMSMNQSLYTSDDNFDCVDDNCENCSNVIACCLGCVENVLSCLPGACSSIYTSCCSPQNQFANGLDTGYTDAAITSTTPGYCNTNDASDHPCQSSVGACGYLFGYCIQSLCESKFCASCCSCSCLSRTNTSQQNRNNRPIQSQQRIVQTNDYKNLIGIVPAVSVVAIHSVQSQNKYRHQNRNLHYDHHESKEAEIARDHHLLISHDLDFKKNQALTTVSGKVLGHNIARKHFTMLGDVLEAAHESNPFVDSCAKPLGFVINPVMSEHEKEIKILDIEKRKIFLVRAKHPRVDKKKRLIDRKVNYELSQNEHTGSIENITHDWQEVLKKNKK